jgi:hypothetical protein
MDSLQLCLSAHHVAVAAPARIAFAGFCLERRLLKGDPPGFCRLYLSNGVVKVELLPSKGLTVGEAWCGREQIFWTPPIPRLQDMSGYDLTNDSMLVNGESRKGFKWLESYMGGIELLGLENWGAPWTDPATGRFLSLHGQANCIPVPAVDVEMTADYAEVRGRALVRTFEGGSGPWHERGEARFTVTRAVRLEREANGLACTDRIENVGPAPGVPDWGYHITFKPVAGAEWLTPSRLVRQRFGGSFPDTIETWRPAKTPLKREEYGIIHQGLKTTAGALNGRGGVQTLLLYPSGRGIRLAFPQPRYCQSWLSMGGKGSREFCRPDGTSILFNAWNGIGCEIGASALDHDGFEDPAVPPRTLQPGEALEIPLRIDVLKPAQARKLAAEIREYSAGRRKLAEEKE